MIKIEIPWSKSARAHREDQRKLQQIEKLKAKERLDQDLFERGGELKEALIKAGIHPFTRINRNLQDEYVFMFGILNGQLVRADMGRKGYFLIKYVGKDDHAPTT